MNTQLIGLCGRKGSGKTTIAKSLKNWARASFAQPLRSMVAAMGVDDKYLYDPNFKEVPIPRIGFTGRFLLQTLGTEWGRQTVDENFWVRIMEMKLDKLDGPVVIDDVRFDNEARMIRERGGKIYQVVTPGVPAAEDGHASERGVSPELVDHVVENFPGLGIPTLPDLPGKTNPLIHKKVVYISGPMRGRPEFNYPRFHEEAAWVTENGGHALNPAEHFDGDTTLPWETYMERDLLAILEEVEAVILLPGWARSVGAYREFLVADSLAIPCYVREGDTLVRINKE